MPWDDASLTTNVATAGGFGLLGRLVYWAHHQSHHPIGLSLLWELPLALGMGFIGMGIGEYLQLTEKQTDALMICVSYVGPRVIDILLLRMTSKK